MKSLIATTTPLGPAVVAGGGGAEPTRYALTVEICPLEMRPVMHYRSESAR